MNFIDSNNLPDNFKQVGRVDCSYNPGEYFLLYVSGKTLYFLNKYPAKPMLVRGKLIDTREPGYNLAQFELPIAALPWLIDTIENKFWKKASEGGLSGDVLHVDNVVEGEDLRVRFSPNCGDEGVQGFTLENYSRTDRGQNWQDMQTPYTLLREDGLLDLLKDISMKHRQGLL